MKQLHFTKIKKMAQGNLEELKNEKELEDVIAEFAQTIAVMYYRALFIAKAALKVGTKNRLLINNTTALNGVAPGLSDMAATMGINMNALALEENREGLPVSTGKNAPHIQPDLIKIQKLIDDAKTVLDSPEGLLAVKKELEKEINPFVSEFDQVVADFPGLDDVVEALAVLTKEALIKFEAKLAQESDKKQRRKPKRGALSNTDRAPRGEDVERNESGVEIVREGRKSALPERGALSNEVRKPREIKKPVTEPGKEANEKPDPNKEEEARASLVGTANKEINELSLNTGVNLEAFVAGAFDVWVKGGGTAIAWNNSPNEVRDKIILMSANELIKGLVFPVHPITSPELMKAISELPEEKSLDEIIGLALIKKKCSIEIWNRTKPQSREKTMFSIVKGLMPKEAK